MASTRRSQAIVVGVDVGSPRKGSHAVALRGGAFLETFEAPAPGRVAAWCREVEAEVVGVDAPCRWSPDGRARPAERELMAQGIWCFATPTRDAAESHPTGYYDWMLAGMELYDQLRPTHRLLAGLPVPEGDRVCFETFPHAAACALLGGIVSARYKRRDRREALQRAGIALEPASSMDLVDAALCALTAWRLLQNRVTLRGEAMTGFIVVPTDALPV